jgi:hypothetical protein
MPNEHQIVAIGAMLTQRGVDLDVARWELASEVYGTLEDYRPVQIADRPSLLKAYSTITLIEALPVDPVLGRALGIFRERVTDGEAVNARRLSVVAGVIFDLEEMRPRATERPEMLESMLQQLLLFLHGVWRVELPECKRLVRLWATRMTRRYDLLPREWREL